MEKKYFSGFTLVELMIVVSIIVILAALILIAFTGQIFKGNDAKRKGDLDRIKIAVEEYEKDHNCYPLPQFVTCKPTGTGLQPYLDRIPCDPITGASYYYDYENSVCPSWFKIYPILENTKDRSATPGIGNQGAFNYAVTSDNVASTPVAVPTSSSGPAPTPVPQQNFYGCRSLACVQISWDSSRPGPECDPNYQNSSCYGQCLNPSYECASWH